MSHLSYKNGVYYITNDYIEELHKLHFLPHIKNSPRLFNVRPPCVDCWEEKGCRVQGAGTRAGREEREEEVKGCLREREGKGKG